MADRGDGSHGQWGTWAMGHVGDGHMDIVMHRSRCGTVEMRHMGNGAHI